MSLRPSLAPALHQRQALTPGMQYGLRILQMSAPDMAEEIRREADENPFLQVDSSPVRAAEATAFDLIAASPSLGERLRRQIGAMHLPPVVRLVADYLTGALREDGYLDTTVEEVARDTRQPRERVEAALSALQRCEPTGVGARDLAECLALQLGDHGYSRDRANQIVAHLQLFAARRWQELARHLDLSPPEVEDIAATLKKLNPRPVAETALPVVRLTPDLIISRDESGRLAVALNPAAIPRVTLDMALIQSAKRSGAPLLTERRDRARRLLSALDARGRTLLRIGEHLITEQTAFFDHGPAALRPRTRRDLAFALALHPATVSRALAGKALLFHDQLHPLGMFFAPALSGPDGVAVSAPAVQAMIRDLIAAEAPQAPLADDAICARLKESGVDIARRTVAKYRKCMRIPSSSRRRRR